jgi:hypothetical protein
VSKLAENNNKYFGYFRCHNKLKNIPHTLLKDYATLIPLGLLILQDQWLLGRVILQNTTLLSNAMSESYLKHLLTTFSINLFNHLCFIQLFTPFCPGGGFRTLSITFSQENYVIIFTQIFVPLIAQYFNLLRNDEVLFV